MFFRPLGATVINTALKCGHMAHRLRPKTWPAFWILMIGVGMSDDLIPAGVIKQLKLQRALELSRKHQSFTHDAYRFTLLDKTFSTFKPYDYSKYSKKKLREILLRAFPEYMRPGAEKYMESVLNFSEHFQIDPLWAVAIAWTESHFDQKATSIVGARGVMQIMPDTAIYLNKIMKIYGLTKKNLNPLTSAKDNIYMGTFYLKMLYEKFDKNYVHATVSYNMGPYWALKIIKKGNTIDKNHLYLRKVTKNYQLLAIELRHQLNLDSYDYQNSLAYEHQQKILVHPRYSVQTLSTVGSLAL